MTLGDFSDPGTRRFVVFEGYDGAGKSTLINELRSRLPERSVRVIGRKSEPQLAGIAKVLEREDVRPTPSGEMLLRIAIEIERLAVMSEPGPDEMVVLDRGLVSLLSWFDYLDVSRAPYEPLLTQLSARYRRAVTIVCRADFETCWARSSQRSDQSRKDRLGKEVNRRYFEQYEFNLQAQPEGDVVNVDTVALEVAEAADLVLAAIASRGF